MQFQPLPIVIWTDDTFINMSPEQRSIFIYLYANPSCTRCGVYKLQMNMMALSMGIMVNGPIESALKAVYTLFPKLVAYDEETGEVALLQYPKHLLLEASKEVLLVAKKSTERIESAFLLRKMIESNSATLGDMYLKRLRQIVGGENALKKPTYQENSNISEKDLAEVNHAKATDNQVDILQKEKRREEKRREDVQGSNFSSFEDEEEAENFKNPENENQAPQVKAQILEEEQAPHIKESNICSDGLKETEYKQALMTLLKKFAREYWDRPDIDTFLDYCWIEGKRFEIKKYGMKKNVPGLLELLKTHFEGEIGEMNKKKAEVSADHSEIEGLVEKTIEYCNKWWKDEWRLYPELINMRKSHEKEKAAIKKLLMRNKKKEVSLIMFVYWKEPMVMNQRMESDWVSIEGNFNNVLELAEDLYNGHQFWVVPGWPKQ